MQDDITNAELIPKIKAEIERRLKDYWKICFHDVKAYNEDSNVRELKELLSFIRTLEESEKLASTDLEEAAKEYIKGYGYANISSIYYAFIAGSQWQEKKNQETIKLAEDHAFLAGADWQKDQMLKEAVEGEITKDNRGNNVLRIGLLNNDFEIGDKVRVIVLPQGKLIWRAKDE
jgi:hypothetical protein